MSVALIVLLQDIQIFPAAVPSLLASPERNPSTLPAQVESSFVETSDRVRIETWRLPGDPTAKSSPYIGIVFHGNGGTIDDFFSLQQWFAAQGMVSYGFDYRGYGKSSGWPSEEGIYRDAEAVWKYVQQKESVSGDRIIVLGFSIGAGAAAKLAMDIEPRALVLLSPYSSITQLLLERPLLKFLKPFLRYSFPTAKYVSRLKQTGLVIAHGTQDTIIPFSHSETVLAAYRGNYPAQTVYEDGLGHNDLFFGVERRLTAALEAVILSTESGRRSAK